MAEKKQFEKALRGALVRWNEVERQREDREEIPPMPASFLDSVPPVRQKNTQRKKEDLPMKQSRNWKKSTVAAFAAAALVAGSVCVYAAVPVVREYINMLFLREESVMRLTEVPEGYIGITTAEELESVRENLSGNYILMNDIRIPDAWYEEGGIYEDGFLPIGMEIVAPNPDNDYTFRRIKPYTGIFNGNGYVISNVHIEADGDDDYVGLFGISEMQFQLRSDEDLDYAYDANATGGIIKNLGVTDSSIVVEEEEQTICASSIGMIVGQGTFVVGCYTDNVTITYEHPLPYGYSYSYTNENISDTGDEYISHAIKIGGIAGEASIIDSCWSGADICINGATPRENKMFVAGVCGYTATCVTSYFDGSITAPISDWEVAYTIQVDPPTMLTREAVWEICFRMIEADNPGICINREKYMSVMKWREVELGILEDNSGLEYYDMYNAQKFMAFYASTNFSMVQNYMTYPIEETPEGSYSYLLDPSLKDRERRALSQLIANVFTGEEFVKFCQENGVKYGAYDNYDLRREPDCDFEGFDFNYIWYRGEGENPTLRLFGYPGGEKKQETNIPKDIAR